MVTRVLAIDNIKKVVIFKELALFMFFKLLPARGGWTSLQARANLLAIYAFHKFLTSSFLSAIIMAGALARARAALAAPCRSCMHFLHSTLIKINLNVQVLNMDLNVCIEIVLKLYKDLASLQN